MQDKFSIEAGKCQTCKDYQQQRKLQEHHANQALLQTTKTFFEKNIEVIMQRWEVHIQYHEHTFIPAIVVNPD